MEGKVVIKLSTLGAPKGRPSCNRVVTYRLDEALRKNKACTLLLLR